MRAGGSTGAPEPRNALRVTVGDEFEMLDLGEPREPERTWSPRRQAAAIGVLLAIVAVVVAVVVATEGHNAAKQHALSPLPISPGSATASQAFNVAPPPVPPESFPPPPLPPCRLRVVRSTAEVRPTTGGVVGVVTATAHNCHFPIRMAPIALVSGGRPIAGIPLIPNADHINPATDDAEPALAVGQISFGFSWTGSWCGERAQAIRLSYRRETFDVPLSGPQPSCVNGRSDSALIRGTAGGIGEPVQGAQPAWRALTARLTVRPNSYHSALTRLRVTLTNVTAERVSLNPIPTYIIGVVDALGDGTSEEIAAPLPFPSSRLVVPAHGTLTLDLPRVSYAPDRRGFRTGYPITVTFAIAGVPNATATTIVR